MRWTTHPTQCVSLTKMGNRVRLGEEPQERVNVNSFELDINSGEKNSADFAIFGMAFAIFQLPRMGANMGLMLVNNSTLIHMVEFSKRDP